MSRGAGYLREVEPSAAIAVIETDLRHLVQAVLGAARGDSWLETAFPADVRERLEKRRREEQARRAPAKVPSSLLAYAHFYEIRNVIEKDWELFAPALGAKREFSVLAEKVEDFRNAPAHSRELLPHERALLDGIAGTIRTQVTSHLSDRAPDARHYPVVESIRDSFGNEPEAFEPSAVGTLVTTGLRLKVGDEVQFDARGWDPQGRELTWGYRSIGGTASDGSVSGTDVSFTMTISGADVGENYFVEVVLKSSGAYHRHSRFDQKITFGYSVDPPDSALT